jgi:hypothetical protein
MRIRQTVFCLALSIGACILVRCSTDGIAGGTIETTNGDVKATVMYPDSTPVANASVLIRRADYLADTVEDDNAQPEPDAITDDQGRFVLPEVLPGVYRIEINDNAGMAALIDIQVRGNTELPVQTLTPVAAVSGTAMLDTEGRAFVQVYGMQRLAFIQSASGGFVFSNLPHGIYRLRIVSSSDRFEPLEIDNVQANADDTAHVLALPEWRYATRVSLNTTPDGGGITDNLDGFPLLVRLGPQNFDFSQARGHGEDIRFSDLDGAALPFEIETWDSAAGMAALWVRLDTVYGDTECQYATMSWGNPSAQTQSNAAEVFDTADGFAGVWHLSGPPGRYPDATINGNTGQRIARPDSIGVIGLCASFTDSGGFINCGMGPSLAMGEEFTLSAWIKLADVSSDRSRRVVSNKWPWSDSLGCELVCNPVLDGGFVSLVAQDFLEVRGYINDLPSLSPVWESRWYYCAVTVDGSTGIVFKDGIELARDTTDSVLVRPSTQPLIIGGTGSDWVNGLIDEVRVEKWGRSGDWVRLNFETQREDQKAVSIR